MLGGVARMDCGARRIAGAVGSWMQLRLCKYVVQWEYIMLAKWRAEQRKKTRHRGLWKYCSVFMSSVALLLVAVIARGAASGCSNHDHGMVSMFVLILSCNFILTIAISQSSQA
ncbi:hypothetical protein SE18_19570 [Herpetosiphon geysericola]|uniref:Uncharacterized protein n=1 Tax=Herpetosiphon geysericola TaxID=70996 RepID=A0A0P6XRE1_9CHLR|nr:hypothetical protein SE18_19570 [Herpetosiphon geysericola]